MDLWGRLQPRLEELRGHAAEEAIDYDRDSERALEGFLSQLENPRKPLLFLTDPGLLRAQWRGEAGRQVSITFRGQIAVSYVILHPEGHLTGASGHPGALALIQEHGLLALLTGQDG